MRGLIRQDIDTAIAGPLPTLPFWAQLAKMGYTVKHGANIRYAAVRPPGGTRFIRLASLGDGYTEEDIKKRLAGVRSGEIPHAGAAAPSAAPALYCQKQADAPPPTAKANGFPRPVCLFHLYLLGVRKPAARRAPVPFSVRKEVTKLNRYAAQFRFLQANRVNSAEQLTMLGDALQAKIDALTKQRKNLYRQKAARAGRGAGDTGHQPNAAPPAPKSSRPAARLNRLSLISGRRRSFAGTRREREQNHQHEKSH